jgi:hypothetical protein
VTCKVWNFVLNQFEVLTSSVISRFVNKSVRTAMFFFAGDALVSSTLTIESRGELV